MVMSVASSHQILDLEETEGRGPAGHEGDRDGHGDEGHHARLAIAEFGHRPAQEDAAPVHEDDRAQDGRDELRAWKDGCLVAQPHLDFVAPEHDRDGQEQAQPEAVAEHRHRVALVAVMARMGLRSVLVLSMVGHDGYGVVMLVVCVHAGRPWIRVLTVPTRADGDDTRSADPLVSISSWSR